MRKHEKNKCKVCTSYRRRQERTRKNKLIREIKENDSLFCSRKFILFQFEIFPWLYAVERLHCQSMHISQNFFVFVCRLQQQTFVKNSNLTSFFWTKFFYLHFDYHRAFYVRELLIHVLRRFEMNDMGITFARVAGVFGDRIMSFYKEIKFNRRLCGCRL